MKYWFVAKKYGYGWVPATREGWLVLLGYFILVAAGAWFISSLFPDGQDFLVVFLPWVFMLSVALVLIAHRTGEPPRWHWGK